MSAGAAASEAGSTNTRQASTGGGGGGGGASTTEFEPPLACVRRLLKNSLPSCNVGKDASSAFARACGIFVIYLTTCANDFARENKRQTITANDLMAAVTELEFDEFTPQLTAFLEQHRAEEKKKKREKDAKKAAEAEAARAAEENDHDEDESTGPSPKKKSKLNPKAGSPEKSVADESAAPAAEDDDEDGDDHAKDEEEDDDDPSAMAASSHAGDEAEE